MKEYVKLLRPHHYLKNLLVFSVLVFSGQLFNTEKLITNALAFVIFCLLSSVIYIFNDICDVEKDRLHHTKKNRPIASGKVSIKRAWIIAIVLFIASFSINYCIFKISSTLVLLTYLLLNIGYSLGLKNIPIIDLGILVSGFLLRVLYGSYVSNIEISNWLYLTVIAASFYFALGKRRNEYRKASTGETRAVLKEYTENFLDKNMYMCLALTNAFYALWSVDQSTIAHYNNKNLVITVPLVLIITMKYCLNIEKTSDGDPVEVLLHDKVLLILCVSFILIVLGLLYL